MGVPCNAADWQTGAEHSPCHLTGLRGRDARQVSRMRVKGDEVLARDKGGQVGEVVAAGVRGRRGRAMPLMSNVRLRMQGQGQQVSASALGSGPLGRQRGGCS